MFFSILCFIEYILCISDLKLVKFQYKINVTVDIHNNHKILEYLSCTLKVIKYY